MREAHKDYDFHICVCNRATVGGGPLMWNVVEEALETGFECQYPSTEGHG